jgi:hypothetical protein
VRATRLTKGGKPVVSLKAGRYRVAVMDEDPAAGLTVRLASGKAPSVASGVVFTGKRASVVQLKPGRWMYYTTLGRIRYFTVTA